MLIDPNGNPSLAFTLYAAECEGDVATATGIRNKIIKNLRQASLYRAINETDVRLEAAAAGFEGYLSDQEVSQILGDVYNV